LTERETLSEYEVIALGKLMQDVYSGVERILRYLLQCRGITFEKSASWHKDLLVKSREEGFLSPAQFDSFFNLLLFRHLQIHGYGHNLDANRLRQLAVPLPELCNNFLQAFPL